MLDLWGLRWSDRLPIIVGGARELSFMHPHDRLKREGLGEQLGVLRPVVEQAWRRDKPVSAPRVVPGESMKLRTAKVKFRRVHVDAGPNAPLLKRVVKYPYRYDELARPRRTKFEIGLSSRMKREAFPRPIQILETYRGPRVVGNPLRNYSFRADPLQRPPSVQRWLDVRGEE